jgi:hypothetical protein
MTAPKQKRLPKDLREARVMIADVTKATVEALTRDVLRAQGGEEVASLEEHGNALRALDASDTALAIAQDHLHAYRQFHNNKDELFNGVPRGYPEQLIKNARDLKLFHDMATSTLALWVNLLKSKQEDARTTERDLLLQNIVKNLADGDTRIAVEHTKSSRSKFGTPVKMKDGEGLLGEGAVVDALTIKLAQKGLPVQTVPDRKPGEPLKK